MAKTPTTRGGTYSGGGNQSSRKGEDGYSQDESAGWGEEGGESVEEEGEAPKPASRKMGAAARIAEALREQEGSAISRADDEPYTREKEDLYRGSRPGEESQSDDISSDDSGRRGEKGRTGDAKRGRDGDVRDLSGL